MSQDFKIPYQDLTDININNLIVERNTLIQENKQLKERFENLVQEHIDTITRNEEKQQRIDKAIEVLKEIEGCDAYIKEVLEILGDKENE